MDVSLDGHGFAVGTNDLVLRLNPATKTWDLIPGYGQNWKLEAVDYLDGSGGNVAVVGGTNVIMTVDAGDTWTEFDDELFTVHTLKMFSTTDIIAVSDAGAYRLENNIWVNLGVPATAPLRGAFILDSQHIWAYSSGSSPAIYSTTNGGMTWNTNLDLSDVDVVRFYDALNGIATDGRDVYRTKNGGVKWNLAGDNALPNTVNDLSYGASAHVILGATLDAEPTVSVDSGKTWLSIDPGLVNQRSFSTATVSDDEFWIGNDLSSVIHSVDGGTTWTEKSGPQRNIINDVYFITRSLGFATGQTGMLLRTFDGGDNWEEVFFGNRNHLSIHGLSASDLWLGANQRIYHSDDSASTWTESLVVLGGNINDILAISSQRVLAASSSGVIYRTNDGGASWDTVYNAGVQLKSIAKIDDQRYMATGFNGIILRSADQGETWSVITPPEPALQYEQAFFLDSIGWLVTSSFKHEMWSTTNAGDSWTPITLPVDRFWDGVYFITPDTGIVVARSTNEGRAYITFNGGQNWSSGYVTTFPLFGVAGVPNPNGTAWIFGYGSDIEVLPYCNTFPVVNNFDGNLTPCQGTTMTYIVYAENVENFLWTFPAGWQVTGNANNDTVQVVVGITTGFISVVGVNACGETGALNFIATPTLLPVLFSIGGESDPCEGTLVNYNVFHNNANNFVWTLPPGWTIESDPNQPIVMVRVGSTNGAISVIGTNECGTANVVNLPVSSQALPTLTLVSGDLSPCPGDTVLYTFNTQVTNSITLLNQVGLDDWILLGGFLEVIAGHEPGSFDLIASNDCGFSQPLTMVFDPLFVPEFGVESAGTEIHPSVVGVAYQWLLNGQPVSGATQEFYTPVVSGYYTVIVTFANGCSAESVAGLNVVISGIFGPSDVLPLEVYPVPAGEKLFIKNITGEFSYEIVDLAGRVLSIGETDVPEIDITVLQSGYYMLNLISDQTRYTAKFIRE